MFDRTTKAFRLPNRVLFATVMQESLSEIHEDIHQFGLYNENGFVLRYICTDALHLLHHLNVEMVNLESLDSH